ncbi:MAG: urea transporter [Candidatus Cloacimonetes bacterium]|nr:urea transporter [Candidatus Cloacimonadota bacterium]
MKKHILHYIDNLLYSYSTLLFMHNRIVGAILLITTFFNKNIALLGLISWLTTFIFARFIGIKKDDVVHTIYTYNSLLVGFSIGFLFKISFLSIFLTVGTSILTVLLSYTLYSLFSYYLRLPVLNIPFTMVSTIIYLASVKYSALFVDSFYPHDMLNIPSLPASIQGLFRTFGVLLFSPYDIIGILVLVAILVYSRISFILAILSYYLGISVLALLKGSYAQAYADISTFNFILVGMALGGIFFIPSKRSYTLALIGVIVSVFILDAVSVFWSSFGIPVFTLPFNIVVLLFVYVLMNLGYKRINLFIKESPEASLASFLNFRKRFDYITPQPYLPFSGKWTVYQSFDDIWTHKGHWQYAYDFVITDEEGNTFCKKGTKLEDYYCYGKPVLSPIDGTVVDGYDQLKDNPIGSVDKKNNWGNYIIIQSEFGYYVEISHLQTKSLQVKIGDSVKFGAILGNCGNSGYSPLPHIHMQIQFLPNLASQTIEFNISFCKK